MGGLEQMIRSEKNKTPNILTIDIETSPVIAYTWASNMYETGLIEVIEEGKIITYSAKWLNGKQITKSIADYKGYKPHVVDDKEIVKDIHALFDKADIVVTQNGVAFDSKYINSRFLAHSMKPPSPYKNIDTKLEAKKLLKLPSYSLDNMGEYFKLGRKMEHEGFPLWKKCMAGNKQAWAKMKLYNAKDVLLTEKMYLKLMPYMKSHPNVTAYSSETRPHKQIDTGNCPKCKSDKTQARGYIVNSVSKYARAQCTECGGWYRYGNNLMQKGSKPGINI